MTSPVRASAKDSVRQYLSLPTGKPAQPTFSMKLLEEGELGLAQASLARQEARRLKSLFIRVVRLAEHAGNGVASRASLPRDAAADDLHNVIVALGVVDKLDRRADVADLVRTAVEVPLLRLLILGD